ncbi:MAG: hypothetical protein JST33_09455 [Actinobacteria bacterium]|nr:hypothetical protein [Actinomycetota bacterium]
MTALRPVEGSDDAARAVSAPSGLGLAAKTAGPADLVAVGDNTLLAVPLAGAFAALGVRRVRQRRRGAPENRDTASIG